MNTRDINKEYIKIIENNIDISRNETAALKNIFREEALEYHKHLATDFLCVPKFYTPEITKQFKLLVKQCYAILIKIIKRYLADESYRRLFGFDSLLEKMILSPAHYECLIPLMRMDIFFNEDTYDFKFCEFNTDGTSGMHEEMIISSRLMNSTAYEKFSEGVNIYQYPLVDGWIKTFTDIYGNYAKKTDNPNIAIVDFLESGVGEEFETFRKRFVKKGYNTIISDIRELDYDGKNLYHGKTKIDAIYRRAVTDEIMRKADTVKPFCRAVEDGNVCLIGHIRTQVAHNKILFYIINREETLSFMEPHERDFIKKHFPFTTKLSNNDYNAEEVLAHKDDWVIKPTDFYASQNVSVGRDLDEERWKESFYDGINKGYILQRFCEPYKSENCRFDANGNLEKNEYMNMTGLYVYGGEFAGIYSRASTNATISSNYGGYSLGTLFIKE